MDAPGREGSPCIWMQAGVVRRRLCRLDYACAACRFDGALGREARRNRIMRASGSPPRGRRGGIVSWQERLRELAPQRRPCIHHLKRRIGFRACLHDYDCASCEFDQFFSDQYTVFAGLRPVDLLNVQGVRFPQGYYLHPGHCWVRLEEGRSVRVGLDDFALRVFGPLERIEGALIGVRLRRGQAAFVLRRGGRRTPVLSPITGVVTAANAPLAAEAARTDDDPYGAGWVLQVEAEELRRDLAALQMGAEAGAFLAAELARLERLIERRSGPLTTDGGFLGRNIIGHLPQLGWRSLARRFLRV